MTLVLPFGVDQIANNSLYSVSGSNQNSTMPCVFDNDSFDRDFESALMRDWSSDISDYDVPAEDSPIKTPSDTHGLKRKVEDELEKPVSKKPRVSNEVPPVSSDVVPSAPSDTDDVCPSSSPSLSCSSFLSSSLSSPSNSASSSSSSSSSSEGQDDDASAEMDDDDYMPRRRPYQMWTSRQRWKDERKKVMKMSVTKLSEIDDPELCLLRSVLINNTIKKLHSDIRSERQAKLRQRQQRMDFFVERLSPVSNSADNSEQFTATDFSTGATSNEVVKPSSPANTTDFYDDSSCDEIFGINEDFLRVPVPDRRVSSPIPTTNNNRDSRNNDTEEPMDTTPVVTTANVTCYSNNNSSLPCDTTNDCSLPFYHRRTTTQNNNNNHSGSNNNLAAFPSAAPSPSCLKQILASASTAAGSQCATQYRTNRDVGGGGESFPPRVPILDEVVYHSLLASLETS